MALVRRGVVGPLVVVVMLLWTPSALATTRLVDDDKAQCPSATFTEIQAAVNAASPGDSVLVCNGVYPEQVTIAKSNLRLRATVIHGAIIQDPPAGTNAGIVRVTGAGVSGVEVSRFVIEKNPNSGPAQLGLEVAFGSSLKTARNNLIRQTHNGVFVDGVARDISYNTIQAYSTVGIAVSGAGRSAAMDFNAIAGQPGTTAGILINNGAGGSAIGNRIVGNEGFGGIGLSAPANSGVIVKHNRVSDNIRGIFLSHTHGARIAWNHVSGNDNEGIVAIEDSTGNKFDHNDARSNDGTDCVDGTTGPGTAGTANTWISNRGFESLPPGICKP